MANGSNQKTAIVVLNWNGWKDTIECLESLLKIERPEHRVIVVDNGSTDDSLTRISGWMKGRGNFELVETGANLGYARGNNAGIKLALSDPGVRFVMILNNDTVVTKDCLVGMIDVLQKDASAALAGPRILDSDSGKFWRSAMPKRPGFFTLLMFSTPLKRFFSRLPAVNLHSIRGDSPRKVYAVSGSCMLFKKDVLEEIGSFDEATFLGWEEFIVAEKLRSRKFSTFTVPGSVIYHKWGASTAKIPSAAKTAAFLESEMYFQRNYLRLPTWQYVILNAVRLCIFALYSIISADYRKNLGRLASLMFREDAK